jgi:hypothetical protein
MAAACTSRIRLSAPGIGGCAIFSRPAMRPKGWGEHGFRSKESRGGLTTGLYLTGFRLPICEM